MIFWGNTPHASTDDTAALINRLKMPTSPPYLVWEFEGQAIGTGGIHKDAELGFIIHPDHWGKGLAAEACVALIEHIWATTKFTKITADADPRNLKSVRLLTKLGFQVSGFASGNFYEDGSWTDSVYFTLPRPT